MAIQAYNTATPRIGKVAPGTKKRGIINAAMRAPKHNTRHPKTGRYCKAK